jgi:hypothetical protein
MLAQERRRYEVTVKLLKKLRFWFFYFYRERR